MDTGRAAAVAEGHRRIGNETVNAVAVSADGRTFLTGGADGTVRFWTADGRPAAAPLEVGARVKGLAASPDGRLVVAGRNGVRIWTLPPDGPPSALPAAAGDVAAFAVCPDGRWVAAAGGRIWSGAAGGRVQEIRRPPGRGEVVGLAVAADGGRIAVGLNDGRVSLLPRPAP